MWVIFLPSLNLEEVLDQYVPKTEIIQSETASNKAITINDIRHLSDEDKVIVLHIGNSTFIIPEKRLFEEQELKGHLEDYHFTATFHPEKGVKIVDTEEAPLPYETSNWLQVSSLYDNALVLH
ncbi:hypothetical protein [Sediminitomix flava]|uniref:Uncharacterized protein n=1 Tax=Sediminitomix flava TaxID=379075 RepID=A0A315ZHT4_SEDFL|nr:hypothetical protein [Sediminitomix flava]PWJ44378.1 hypothetical protein BC781_101728 [Sediminitomix flava]